MIVHDLDRATIEDRLDIPMIDTTADVPPTGTMTTMTVAGKYFARSLRHQTSFRLVFAILPIAS